MKNSLNEYKKKRNFTKSPEPKPKIQKNNKRKNIFVIQKHHASHLHYDFRLEVNGVLRSWVVPKGPSTDPEQKRLAVQTEDHPIDYATFEGIIPEGYGAGTVIVWDIGTYENITEKNNAPISMTQGLKNGHVKVILHGQKLKGEFALTNFKGNNWLLIKMSDAYADTQKDPIRTQPVSALSNLTIKKLDEEFTKQKEKKQ